LAYDLTRIKRGRKKEKNKKDQKEPKKRKKKRKKKNRIIRKRKANRDVPCVFADASFPKTEEKGKREGTHLYLLLYSLILYIIKGEEERAPEPQALRDARGKKRKGRNAALRQ